MLSAIQKARVLAGKTQKEMAQQLDMSRDKYRKIEKNPEYATIADAKRISEITGFTIDDIFSLNNSTFGRYLDDANNAG